MESGGQSDDWRTWRIAPPNLLEDSNEEWDDDEDEPPELLPLLDRSLPQLTPPYCRLRDRGKSTPVATMEAAKRALSRSDYRAVCDLLGGQCDGELAETTGERQAWLLMYHLEWRWLSLQQR
jgi:hypothetical protein